VIIKFNFSITIPDRLIGPSVALVLFYRRIHYGYPFRRIPLTQGQYAIVDPEDYERLNKHKWHAKKYKNTFYAARNIRIGKNKKWLPIQMHREILRVPDGMLVDHINHNGLDNRKANLRPATHSQNCRNRTYINRKNSSSKYKGVTWHRHTKKWYVRIRHNNKRKTVGLFHDEIQAAKAYDEATRKFHGEFAVTNFKT
jgi:hypothetical protein